MEYLHGIRMSVEEHKNLRNAPLTLMLPPSSSPIEITLEVVGKRMSREIAPEPKASRNGKPDSLRCDECGATTNAVGKPFTEKSINLHIYKKHGKNAARAAAKKAAGGGE